MREATRLALLEVLRNEMGVDPELVARDGANSDGFYVFAGLKFNRAEKLRAFVTWSPAQYAVIENHKDLFHEWFSEED